METKKPPTSGGRFLLPTGELLLPALASHIRGLSLTSMAPWRLHRQVAVFGDRRDESHLGHTGVRGYDLPAVVKLLEIHGGVPHHLLLGTWERDRPPGEGEGEIRLQQLDLDAFGFDEPHRITIRIAVDVGIMKVLPAVKLLRIDDNQQYGRLPVHLQMSLDVVAIPAMKHFEQDFVDLLAIRLGNAWIGDER